MPVAKPKPGRFRKLFRWIRRIALVLLLLVCLGVFLGQRYLASPDRLARLASDWLSQSLGAEVSIDQVHFDYDGLVTLQGVHLRVSLDTDSGDEPGPHDQSTREVIHVPMIALEHNLWSLLTGKFEPLRVTVIEPSIFFTEDLKNGGYLFARLNPVAPADDAGPVKLPNVQLIRADLVFGEIDKQGQYSDRGHLIVGGQFTARGLQRVYDFSLTQALIGAEAGIQLNGDLDLEQGLLNARLDRLHTNRHLRLMADQKFRKILDIYLNRKHHQRLLDQGLIQTSGLRAARVAEAKMLKAAAKLDAPESRRLDELEKLLAIPVFDLGGQARAQFAIQTDSWTTKVNLDVTGVNVVYSQWTWPMTITGGQIIVEPGRITLDHLTTRGINGGKIEFNGPVVPSNDEISQDIPDVALTAHQLPIDQFLLSSIPKPYDKWIRDFGFDASVNVTGGIYRKPHQLVEYGFEGTLVQGSARPFDGDYELEQLQGSFEYVPGKVTISKLTGKHGPSTVTFDAECEFVDQTHHVTLAVAGQSVRFEDPIWQLVPPSLPAREATRGLLDTYKPRGLFDVDFTYEEASNEPGTFTLTALPKVASALWQGKRVSFKKMDGKVHVKADRILLENVKGEFEAGTVRISQGVFHLTGDRRIELQIDAKADKISPTALALLPAGPVDTIKALEIKTAYQLINAHLLYVPKGELVRFYGDLKLSRASLNAGMPITDAEAVISFETRISAVKEWPWMKMKIKADSLRIEKRFISPLTLTVLSDDREPNVIKITDLKGRCYGGQINGKVRVDLGKVVRYQFEVNILGVPLAPFGSPEKDKKWMKTYLKPGSRPDSDAATGLITANLKIRGNINDASSKWGAGQFEIHDARIYELPIAMVALHLVNLSLPTSKSFDTVQGDYVIRGDEVRLNKLELKCKTLEILGDGVMDYPSRDVDLLLFTSNPSGPNIPIVSDILSAFKNTLISIHVTGPLADPSANLLHLHGALRTWQDVIKNRPPKKESKWKR